MKILLAFILWLGVPHIPIPEKPVRHKYRHAITNQFIEADSILIYRNGFAMIYLNGKHVLTCWEENLIELN